MSNRQQSLKNLLVKAQAGGYAVGAFNCRYHQMIQAVLEAAEEARSPVCLEIAQPELKNFRIDTDAFMDEVNRVVRDSDITVPFAVHLDHSWDREVFDKALASGFLSVMIDASTKPLDENIAATREIVELAHPKGAGVEAELGKIASADKLETDNDETLYTDPSEARRFVEESGCDYLAVSVGSAHGVYAVKNPTIDFKRIQEIREVVSIPLVLHGGTGIPDETVRTAINVPGGGVSKLNVATELEHAFLAAIGGRERLKPEEIDALSKDDTARGRAAIRDVVLEKIESFLMSKGKA